MRLRFKNKTIGQVTPESSESFEYYGALSLNSSGKKLSEFFAWMVRGDTGPQDPPFEAELLDHKNWSLVDDNKTVIPIYVPAVHLPDEIYWRGREDRE